jgi:hypothetical protein
VRHVRMLGLCLVAVFAFSAVAAGSALAKSPPEFLTCVKAAKIGKKYTGGYNDKGCTVVNGTHEGKYELEPVAEEGVKLTGKSKKTVIATRNQDGKTEIIECKKDRMEGEFHRGFIRGVMTFEGCEANKSKTEVCTSEEAPPGTIEDPFKFILGYLNAEETKFGALTETLVATGFECGGKSEYIEPEGRLIGAVENTTKGVNFIFKTPGGKQEYTSLFSGGKEEKYNLFTEPGKVETTVESQEELSTKGISVRA